MALVRFCLIILMSTGIITALARRRRGKILPKDCSEVTEKKSKVYRINPDGKGAFRVYCDMKTGGGGWTVFQRRIRSKPGNFTRNWADYKGGFGKLSRSFWLGNEYLHRLTANRNFTLRIELKGCVREKHLHATYRTFAVGSEMSNYKLTVGGYKGSAGDPLRNHNSMPFSTRDKDNDRSRRHCAEFYPGGWWYRSCLTANLNGEYLCDERKKKYHGHGIYWQSSKLKKDKHVLSFSEMKLRPANNK